MKFPRVLFVIPGEGLGSNFVFAKRQIEMLSKLGVEPRVFFLKSRNSLSEILKEVKRFQRMIKNWKPDLVHSQFGSINSLFSVLFSGRKTVITFRGSDVNPAPGSGFLRNFIAYCASLVSSRFSSHSICVSKELCQKLFLTPNSKKTVIPTGADTEMFRPIDRKVARKKLGWQLDHKVVLFNGKSVPGKRYDIAYSAFHYALEERDDIQLIALDGDVSPEVVPVIMAASNCLLVTSDYEGSPTVVQEAIACNLPVVSVRVGDVEEILQGVSPSAIVSRDPREIAKALLQILANEDHSNGQEFLFRFSQKNVAEKNLKIYESLKLFSI